TQLSTGKLAEVEIVPNLKDIANASARVSFATFAGQAVYWIADGEYTLKRFNDIRTKILGDLENPSEIDRMVTSRKEFLENSGKATFILLNDNITERAADVRIAFNTSPQPQFN
ncbi:MAG TPA: transcription-repair coupling factor, partial [Alistipes sp.]|nr:transcription-repair coupling factor [Alistipes sp.]